MTPAQKQEINVLLNKAGGENTSEINRLHGEVVGLADQLPASPLKDQIMAKTLQAESHNAVVGATLEQMQQWVNKMPVEVTPTVTDPSSKTAFLTWAATSTQQVTLDGVTVKTGFGPADAWYSLANGMVSRSPVVLEPEVPPIIIPPNSVERTIVWGQEGNIPRYPTGTFTGVACYTVTCPASFNRFTRPFEQFGKASFAEWQGQPWNRILSVSTVPKVFSGPNVLYKTGGTVPVVMFNVFGGGQFNFQPGQTVYFNVMNVNGDGTQATGNYPGSFAISFPHDTGQSPPTA